jgi:DNA-binding LacI/PurR family transcriptional regulator
MRSIAEIAGVSKVTVSKALRGNIDISDYIRDKIKEQASIMGYRSTDMGKRDYAIIMLGATTGLFILDNFEIK